MDDLRKLTPKIDDLANATAKVDQLHGFWKYADKTFNDHQQAVETTIESSLEFEQQAHQLRNQLLVLPDKFSQRDSLVSLGKHRAKLDGLLKQQTELETLQSSQISIVNQVQSEFGQQNIRVKKLEFSWHNNQAALLAAELQIGEVCPVCGSTEHPLKAVFTTESVSKEDVEKAKDVLLSLQNKANEAQNELTQYETQLNGIELAIVDSKTELGDFQFQTTEQLRQDCKQLNSELKKLEQQQILLTKHESDLKLLAEKRIEAERHLELSRENQQNTLREYELSKQTKEQIEQQLPEIYRQPGQLMKSISNLNQQIEDITQAYENALKEFNLATQMLTQLTAKLEQQNSQLKLTEIELSQAKSQWLGSLKSSNFEDESSFLNALRSDDQQQQLQQQIKQFNDQLTGCNATLNQQTKQLKEQKQPDMDLLRRKRDELTDISNETLSVWKHIDNRFQQLNDVQDKLDQAHKTNRALEEEYKIYGTLSDIANGQTGNRISLQRFVLSVLLDDVLEEASHRLNIMSKGRYLLLRKEDKAKGGKASGLELEVEDAYTGKTRSVATLSGGESFMAALSLALGLSDVVQAYAGGIKLDTLFIDEGFGSLDQESLDLAIKTLIDLQATGRMIGIISHVSELREQMPLRIDVITSASGSRVG